jgi:hypothetical protein
VSKKVERTHSCFPQNIFQKGRGSLPSKAKLEKLLLKKQVKKLVGKNIEIVYIDVFLAMYIDILPESRQKAWQNADIFWKRYAIFDISRRTPTTCFYTSICRLRFAPR